VSAEDSDIDEADPTQTQANVYVCIIVFNQKS
jgi:hypothetical protein